jgi:superfamily I DNA/RNA helicase
MWVQFGPDRKVIQADTLAGHVMRAISSFCNSADDEPGEQHFAYIDGIDMPTTDGRRTFANNAEVRRTLLPALRKAWADLSDVNGQLRFSHDIYLKLWQLSRPNLRADFVLFDEAQDASPVMAAAIGYQVHAQRVYVGDSQQAIYGWRGAVNALANLDTDARTFLTQSWRFGDAVAEVANKVLAMIPNAELRLIGCPGMASKVQAVPNPKAILTRTNACAIIELLSAQRAGKRAHLVGGGEEMRRFAKGAQELMDGNRTSYPELACFSSWGEVQMYVSDDPQGSELRLQVKLVDEFGVETILSALDHMPKEEYAELVISTAHKAKGREWSTVRIASDFPAEITGPEELRLLYVAVTRAMDVLDITAVALLSDEEEPKATPAPVAPPTPETPVAPRLCQSCGRTYTPKPQSMACELYCSGLCRSKGATCAA